MKQQISYEYEARDSVEEEREYQYWLDSLASKGKTNETKQERTGNLGEQDARRDSDGGEASQQKQ